ncbi:hypothetical protein LY76DRAFT_377074 [Colletotrichum caudatum]|nr:hypothetical protein LY76DRAFT_377074 [Colletotrichum caudatum]
MRWTGMRVRKGVVVMLLLLPVMPSSMRWFAVQKRLFLPIVLSCSGPLAVCGMWPPSSSLLWRRDVPLLTGLRPYDENPRGAFHVV